MVNKSEESYACNPSEVAEAQQMNGATSILQRSSALQGMQINSNKLCGSFHLL